MNMNTKFELNKSYKFDFNRKVIDKNGYTYFYLKYEGANTIPGYENKSLEFRVRALGFLKDWTEEKIREKMPKIDCFVSDYYPDLHNGELPSFPYLIMDCGFVRRLFFEAGQTYLFTVEGRETDSNTGSEYFSLCDEAIHYRHRYYPQKNILWNSGVKVELCVDSFSDKGYLQLSLTPKENLRLEIASLELAEDLSCSRESERLEFKSSFVYTAEGKEDIDEQLGHEILAQLAGFMNAGGGTVCLGYKDDGSVRGINEDIPFLNTSKIDKYNGQYKETLDSIERKIRTMIKWKLGRDVDPLVQIRFYKALNDRLVCFLKASPSNTNIYLNKDEMYVRSGCTCHRLLGDERLKYQKNCVFKNPIEFDEDILAKQYPKVLVTTTVESAADKIITKNDVQHSDIKVFTSGGNNMDESLFIKVLTIYRNGDASCQSRKVLNQGEYCNIPLTVDMMGEKARLVLIYDGGRVNIVNPAMIIKKKFIESWKRYKNGFNTNAKLLACCVCTVDDTLCVFMDKNGKSDVEAFEVANCNVNESMHTRGKRILKKKYSKIVDVKAISRGLRPSNAVCYIIDNLAA